MINEHPTKQQINCKVYQCITGEIDSAYLFQEQSNPKTVTSIIIPIPDTNKIVITLSYLSSWRLFLSLHFNGQFPGRLRFAGTRMLPSGFYWS